MSCCPQANTYYYCRYFVNCDTTLYVCYGTHWNEQRNRAIERNMNAFNPKLHSLCDDKWKEKSSQLNGKALGFTIQTINCTYSHTHAPRANHENVANQCACMCVCVFRSGKSVVGFALSRTGQLCPIHTIYWRDFSAFVVVGKESRWKRFSIAVDACYSGQRRSFRAVRIWHRRW